MLVSAFDSAGQRCSALRLLYLQDDIADRIVAMLAGAMAELAIGDPALLATDVGPVIDEEARQALQRHAERMDREGRLIYRCALPPDTEHGTFFAPRAFEIDGAGRLEREVFGPILHVVRWPADRLDAVLDEVAATGYGLTLGIHSRIDETVRAHSGPARRRQQLCQPQHDRRGGRGAAVRRRRAERHRARRRAGRAISTASPPSGRVSIDTTAAGGNASLLSLQDGRRAPAPPPRN